MAVINKDNENMDFSVQIARKYGAPIDKDSVFYSMSDAQTYATSSPLAYVGQVIAVVNETAGTVVVYKINTDGTLGEIGAGAVSSVNGQTGAVNLTAGDIGAVDLSSEQTISGAKTFTSTSTKMAGLRLQNGTNFYGAKGGSTIYGNSDTVTPLHIDVCMWRRTA